VSGLVAGSGRTSTSAILAVTIANVEMPTAMVNMPTIRPVAVTGNTSPYPTVVIVADDHHRARRTSRGAVRSRRLRRG
jgi:hypothetical protein